MHIHQTVFILQVEQQEKEPKRQCVCVKLVTPAICLLHIL